MATSRNTQKYSVLASSTMAFTVCFMVWMMFGVIGIPIKKMLDLNATEFGLLTAMPVLTGSLSRLWLGAWTDKYGGRNVLFLIMLICVIPIWMIGYATQYWQFLVLGLFVGLAGGSFSVGTPYVARWFEVNQRGMAMGVFGAGNSGAAVNKFVAPALVAAFGWTMVPHVYAGVMLVAAILFWMFSYSDPSHLVGKSVTLREQLVVLKDPCVWKYCQYYSCLAVCCGRWAAGSPTSTARTTSPGGCCGCPGSACSCCPTRKPISPSRRSMASPPSILASMSTSLPR